MGRVAISAVLLAALCGTALGGSAHGSAEQDHYYLVEYAFDGHPDTQFVSANGLSEVIIGWKYGPATTVLRYGLVHSSGNGLLEERTPRRWVIEGLGGVCGSNNNWGLLSTSPDMTADAWRAMAVRQGVHYTLPMFTVQNPLPCSSYRMRVTMGNTPDGAIKNIALGELLLDTGCTKSPVTCWNGVVLYPDPMCNMQAMCSPCPPDMLYCYSHPFVTEIVPRCHATCPARRCVGGSNVCWDGNIITFLIFFTYFSFSYFRISQHSKLGGSPLRCEAQMKTPLLASITLLFCC